MPIDNKKYLDQEGIKFLWSKISMEDYPNNETLIAILNAIDATKLDKTTFEEFAGESFSAQEPKENDMPKVFIDGIIPTTKAATTKTATPIIIPNFFLLILASYI